MIEYTLFIPVVRDRDRKEIGSRQWTEWQDYLLTRAGGWTLLPCETSGVWQDHHGRETFDRCRRYVVVGLSKQGLLDAVEVAKQTFGQRAIYVSQSNAEIL